MSYENFESIQNRNFKYNIIFNEVSIKVDSEHEFQGGNLLDFANEITGAKINFDSSVLPDGIIEYLVSDDIGIEYDNNEKKLKIIGPVDLFGTGRAISYIAQYMAECFRAENSGRLLVHSAAVKHPEQEKSYLMFGDKGSGKTTIALRLCHQFGYDLIGNDQVIVGEKNGTLITSIGNQWFDVRKTSFNSDPYVNNLLNYLKIDDPTKANWNTKFRIYPDSLGIEVSEKDLPLKKMFHIRIDGTQKKIHISPWKGIQRNLILHEYFGRHITGQSTPFQDDSGNYLGSLPLINTVMALKTRDRIVKTVMGQGVTEIFSPSSEEAAKYIAESGDEF